MASKRIGRTAEEQALFDYQDAGAGFLEGGAAQYQTGNDFNYTKQGNVDQLGNSAYEGIETNPEYEAHQMEALRQLEEQSKDGYSARDKADLARIEQSANRANQGRQGAIRQNMAARGIGGGGLEVVMAQQAAQDAAEQQALQSLETNAQMQDRKMQATSQLGQLSGQLQNNQYNQQAQAAQAKDSISRFNTANRVNTQQTDNAGINSANQQNYDRRNQVADNNVNAGYNYRKDAMGVQQGNAQMAGSYNTEMYNRKQAEKAAKASKKSGQGAMIGSVIGGVGGAMIGGPAGAMVGAQLGGQVGGSFARGGTVPGPEISPYDDPANDVVPAMLSGGEVVLPKSVSTDPQAAAQFVAKENQKKGIDPRILERLSGKNPDMVNKYKSQMDSANQGIDEAVKAAEYGQYANVAGKVLNDYNNSQKSDTIYANDWMRNGGGPPKIDRADRPEYDGSGIEKLGEAGQSKAQARLAEIKAQMKAEAMAQRQGDEFALGRQDKADSEATAQAKFDAEMGFKQAGQEQSADQFNQTFGETKRANMAREGIQGAELEAKQAKEARGPVRDPMDLFSKYNSDPTTKATATVKTSYANINRMLSNPSPANDMSAIFNFMKMQDPESSVREGEYANAQNAAGWDERVRAAYNKAKDGQILTPEMRMDFLQSSKKRYDSQLETQSGVDQRFKQFGDTYGYPTDGVIPSGQAPQQDVKEMNGKQYRKVQGGWEEI